MSKRAEEAALKVYPVEMTPLNYQDLIDQFGGKTEIDVNTYPRCLFQGGYEQAEEDLANAAAFSGGPDGFYYGKGYQQGKKDAEKHLGWHSVDESLPPVDEEVIILHDVASEVAVGPLYCIAFGHIVDRRYAMDYNGWNIPGVKYWMPMPKIPEV